MKINYDEEMPMVRDRNKRFNKICDVNKEGDDD
jgi:hypothetical protein